MSIDQLTLHYQKNPCAHNNKIGTSPPKKSKTPPPCNKEFYGRGAFLPAERTKTSHAPIHKIGAAISGPRIAGRQITDI